MIHFIQDRIGTDRIGSDGMKALGSRAWDTQPADGQFQLPVVS